MDYQIKIQKSKRRTISLSITEDLNALVKAPYFVADREIDAFLQKHQSWIEKHRTLQKEWNAKKAVFSKEQIAGLKEKAGLLVRERLNGYAEKMGVRPAGVKITSAVTRWGSCSGKNRLCFSYRIALLPTEASDYILVHELAHIKVKNHGPKFYAKVAEIMPDYRRRIALLKQAQQNLGL